MSVDRLVIGILIVVGPRLAFAEGISARFGNDAAVLDRDVTVRIEISDPIGAVDRIEIDLRRTGDKTWQTATATPIDPPKVVRWWAAQFARTDVWAPPAPAALEVRARLYGARGGVLLTLGDLQPFPVDVITATEAQRRARVLTRQGRSQDLPFAGYIGIDGRAGTSARARAYLGFGGPVAPRTEIVGAVSLGPAFARPDATAGGGPIVLGGELAVRLYTRRFDAGPWTLFAAPFGTVDVRFPGLDAGGGVRAGIAWVVRSELAVELSLGGAAMMFGAVQADEDDAGLGFTGGLRLGLRLGAINDG